jgi:hypothetical protein
MKLNEMNGGSFTDPEEFYQEVVVSSGLFEKARQRFPGYNNTQSIDAAEWMMDEIECMFSPGDVNWANMRDEVYDKIIAGLT